MKPRSFSLALAATALAAALAAFLLMLPMSPPSGEAWAQGASKKSSKAKSAQPSQPSPISDDEDDPAVWGKVFPLWYDLYLKTTDMERTKYGGSEAVPRTPTGLARMAAPLLSLCGRMLARKSSAVVVARRKW